MSINRSSGAVRTTAAAVAVVGLVVLSACTGDKKKPTPASSGGSQPAIASASAATPEQLSSTLLAAGAEAAGAKSVASGTGTVDIFGDKDTARLTAEILSVTRTPDGTLLVWTLSSPGGEVDLRLGFFATTVSGTSMTDVYLVDAGNDRRLKPYLHSPKGDGPGNRGCVCSGTPVTVGTEGEVLYGLYPALDDGVTSVAVEIPGFKPIPDVPVTAQD